MANEQQLALLKQGVDVWTGWRKEHPDIKPDLAEADLVGVDLKKADLSCANLNEADLTLSNLKEANLAGASLFMAILVNANLSRANLSSTNFTSATLTAATLTSAELTEANLTAAKLTAAKLVNGKLVGAKLNKAILSKADLRGANLSHANLSRANLRGANLSRANLTKANLSRADLSRAILTAKANLNQANLYMAVLSEADCTEAALEGAILNNASLVKTNLTKANLTDCSIYGISAWNVVLDGAIQCNLVITLPNEPTITVDNLEVAQFIYLLLNNQKIRDVLNTITSKVVLILGRFTPERKRVLDAIREELRRQKYLPVLFDFEKPRSRDFTETIVTLAHLSRFVIADLTLPRSIPQELQAIVPSLAVPIQPILEASKKEYSMSRDLKKYAWVLPLYRYNSHADLLTSLEEKVITPAEKKATDLENS
jgi:uncharacterized protein YjbI with pentapeptide repeats